jgi:hypothetical protein
VELFVRRTRELADSSVQARTNLTVAYTVTRVSLADVAKDKF